MRATSTSRALAAREQPSFERDALERALGPGRLFYNDRKNQSIIAHIVFKCGCMARESKAGRFALFIACPQHDVPNEPSY